MIPKPCIRCGRPSPGSYCPQHEEQIRASSMPYRRAYNSSIYRENRRMRMDYAKDQCEAMVGEARCPAVAVETHHVIPLSSARSFEEALALCDWRNLRAVCWPHNPRGSHDAA